MWRSRLNSRYSKYRIVNSEARHTDMPRCISDLAAVAQFVMLLYAKNDAATERDIVLHVADTRCCSGHMRSNVHVPTLSLMAQLFYACVLVSILTTGHSLRDKSAF